MLNLWCDIFRKCTNSLFFGSDTIFSYQLGAFMTIIRSDLEMEEISLIELITY